MELDICLDEVDQLLVAQDEGSPANEPLLSREGDVTTKGVGLDSPEPNAGVEDELPKAPSMPFILLAQVLGEVPDGLLP